jgi:hypothetical protein
MMNTPMNDRSNGENARMEIVFGRMTPLNFSTFSSVQRVITFGNLSLSSLVVAISFSLLSGVSFFIRRAHSVLDQFIQIKTTNQAAAKEEGASINRFPLGGRNLEGVLVADLFGGWVSERWAY